MVTFDFNARMAYQKIKGLSGGADTNESKCSQLNCSQTIIFALCRACDTADDDEENCILYPPLPMERLDDTYK